MKSNNIKKMGTLMSATLLITAALNPMGGFAATSSFKVGDAFKVSGIDTGKAPIVTNVLDGDFTGDKKSDRLYVVGNKFDKTSNYYDNFTVVLKDGKSGKWLVYRPKMEEGYAGWGYDPVLEVSDINADGVKDVLFSSFSGGSGGFTYVDAFTAKGGKFTQVLSQKALTGLNITGKYLDDYKVEINVKDINKTITLDVSFEAKNLQETGYYDAKGKCLKPLEPWLGPVVDVHADAGAVWGVQAIKGVANADTFGQFRMTYGLKNGKLTLLNLDVQYTLMSKYY